VVKFSPPLESDDAGERESGVCIHRGNKSREWLGGRQKTKVAGRWADRKDRKKGLGLGGVAGIENAGGVLERGGDLIYAPGDRLTPRNLVKTTTTEGNLGLSGGDIRRQNKGRVRIQRAAR